MSMSFVLLVLICLIVVVVIICNWMNRKPSKLVKKYGQIPLKGRKRIQRICLGAGFVLTAVFLGRSLIVKKTPSSVQMETKTSKLPLKKLSKEQDETKIDPTYEKYLKKLYNIMAESLYINMLEDTEDFESWIELREDQCEPFAISAEEILGKGGDSYTATSSKFYDLIQKKKNDYVRNYSQLSKKKQKEMQGWSWKEKEGILYAVNGKEGKYLQGTAQMNLENSEFVKSMEKAGFTGISKWMHDCTADKNGIWINTTDGKKRLFHDAGTYHKFTSHGLTFYYNYQCLKIYFDYEKLTGKEDAVKNFPIEIDPEWTVKHTRPGGTYSQIDLNTDIGSFYCAKNMKVLTKDGQICQVTVCAATQEDNLTGENGKMMVRRQDGFYGSEKPFLLKCLKNMGVSEEEAKSWLEQVNFRKDKEGEIGTCHYKMISDARESVYDQRMDGLRSMLVIYK